MVKVVEAETWGQSGWVGQGRWLGRGWGDWMNVAKRLSMAGECTGMGIGGGRGGEGGGLEGEKNPILSFS